MSFQTIRFKSFNRPIKSLSFLLISILCFNSNLKAQDLDSLIQIFSLEEVYIEAPTKAKTVANQTIKTSVIDVQGLSLQTSNIAQLINQTVGIRVRQTGGLGSNTNITFNGFEGKSIKYFKDGIPMDYLGAAFNLSILPMNMVNRVEVYKGVLPTYLAADALGGAVNIVTRQDEQSQKAIDVSYQTGSFGTHRVSLHSIWADPTNHYFVGADLFYNRSKNNYKADLPVINQETAVSYKKRLPLFHNSFSNIYTEVFGGIKNRPWVDELRVGLTYFNIDKDHNYGITMESPYGGITSDMHSFIPTLRYQKGFFKNRLKVDQFLVYNQLFTQYTDTVRGKYDWEGNFTPIPSRRGEASSSGNLTKLKFKNFISRTNVRIPIKEQHTLEFNLLYSSVKRTGSNPYGEKYLHEDLDILTKQADYNKFVMASGLKSYFLNGRLSNNFLFKLYHINSRGYSQLTSSEDYDWLKNNATKWGAGDAIKFNISERTNARLSGEATVRLPDQAEFFGDGGFINANYKLQPERSYNVNFGLQYAQERLTIEWNIFYRRTYDLILLVNTGLYGSYQNVDKVRGVGNEFDLSYTPVKWLKLNGNFTYQDFRLFGQSDEALQNARLRNTPFFFANLGATIQLENILKKRDKVSIYWNYGFVREYYLNYVPKKYESKGFLGLWGRPKVNVDNMTIPNQNLHSIGASWYNNTKHKYGVGIEIRNLFDSKVFDNYRVQNAGRSFNIKLSYSFM